MSFAFILLMLSIITGALYAIDAAYFAPRRTPSQPMPKIFEHARSFFPVFVLVLLLRSFLIEPFRIPSGSLEPTLRVGDFVAVNKFIYGLRLPVFETKIIEISTPHKGDIAVFRWPPDPTLDYIKRVVATPGDVIEYKNKTLIINGVPAEKTFIGYETDESSGAVVAKYKETLNHIEHFVYLRPEAPAVDFKVTIPEGHYFMMGDNRDDSQDSRYWGLVHEQYLRGKAFVVWMSWDGQKDTVRFNRLGHFIH